MIAARIDPAFHVEALVQTIRVLDEFRRRRDERDASAQQAVTEQPLEPAV
jgi:uncharacterized damage-inducible protein DinB